MISADLVAIRDLSRSDLDAWRELAESALVPNPFSDPDFVLAAMDGFETPEIGLLIGRDGGLWRAAMPVHHVGTWRRLPGRRLATWLHPYCFLGTPLLDRAVTPELLAAVLARAVREHGSGFGIDLADAAGPAAAILDAALELHGPSLRFAEFGRAALQRRPDNDYLFTGVSSRHRKEIRRQRRLLETRFDDLRVTDRAGELTSATRFLELEASGWKGKAGTAMACEPGHARFFATACRVLRERGRLEMLFLESGDRPLAAICNLLAGDGIFCFKMAFEEEFASFSPGVQLVVEMIDHFHEDRTSAAWVDSCADPENSMINRLFPDRRALHAVLVSPPGFRGVVVNHTLRAARKLRGG